MNQEKNSKQKKDEHNEKEKFRNKLFISFASLKANLNSNEIFFNNLQELLKLKKLADKENLKELSDIINSYIESYTEKLKKDLDNLKELDQLTNEIKKEIKEIDNNKDN